MLRSIPAPAPAPALAPGVRIPDPVAFLLLYAAALVLLLWRLPGDPPFPHNWEAYTAWHADAVWLNGPDLAAALRPTDGLMTDSGQGPLTGLPIWIGSRFGDELGALRAPLAIVAATGPPLLWLAARRLVPTPAAWLAAMLLALSPVWLLYGRTATIVAPSLAPLLLGVWALATLIEPTVGQTRRGFVAGTAILWAALGAGLYAYAPVRLLWPIAVGVLILAAVAQPRRRSRLSAVAVAALVSVPLTVATADAFFSPESHPARAIARYFAARGEQVLALTPDDYASFLPDAAAPGEPGPADLVARNAADMGNLLADRGTLPVRAEYWNPRGRLWPAAFGGLFAVGAAWAGWRTVRRRDWGTGLLLVLAAGFALPLLLTTRVHVGRLVPALPFLLALAACGGWALAEAFGRAVVRAWSKVRRARSGDDGMAVFGGDGPWSDGWPVRAAAWVGVVAALLGGAAGAARTEWATAPTRTREAAEVDAIAALLDGDGPAGAVVVAALDPMLGDEVIAVRAAAVRLVLAGTGVAATVVSIPAADATTGDSGVPAADSAATTARRSPMPVDGSSALVATVLIGDGRAAIASGVLPDPCAIRYAAQPEVVAGLRDALAACPDVPAIVVLPR